VPILVDTASAVRRLERDAFARWAATRTVFLSSEMRELGELRRTVARALRDAGFSVVVFEDLGGRDEDAEHAYLDGVARSDIYVGVVADRYGTMLATGRSPTHEEYLEARRRGKRISVWLQRDAGGRQGNAADFAQEVQAFHTTGQFTDAEDLSGRLLQRLAEIAADDEAPWVKIGDVLMRASRIRDEGAAIVVMPANGPVQTQRLTTENRGVASSILALAILLRIADCYAVFSRIRHAAYRLSSRAFWTTDWATCPSVFLSSSARFPMIVRFRGRCRTQDNPIPSVLVRNPCPPRRHGCPW
jgi:hypothetical protein